MIHTFAMETIKQGTIELINNPEDAFKVLNYILENKIKVKNIEHQHLKEIINLSVEEYNIFNKNLHELHSKACRNSDNITIEYSEKLINIYQPSDELKEKAYEKSVISNLENNQQRIKHYGWIQKTTIFCIGVATILISHNKTKPINFWQKR